MRVFLAIAGGLVLGLVLVRTFTPRTAELGEDEPVAPTFAPRKVAAVAPPAAGDAGAVRLSQQILAAKLPPYPRAGRWVHIGDTLETNRVPMALASFETSDQDGDVLEFYARYFERAGFPWQGVDESLKNSGLPALSATDVVDGLQLSVIAFPKEHGTTVIVAAADMDGFYERAEAPADEGGLPGYPGAKPTVMRTGDAVMISFATADAVKDVQSFYRDTLGKQGFGEVPVERPAKSKLEQLEFEQRGRTWRLFMAKTASGTSVTATGGLP